MGLELLKGQGLALLKEDPNLKVLEIQVTWGKQQMVGDKFDLDGSIIPYDANGKSREEWMAYYGTKTEVSYEGATWKSVLNGCILHSGDNTEGTTGNDQPGERIVIFLDRIRTEFPDIAGFAVALTIYEAEKRGNQNFGQVDRARIAAFNKETGKELAGYSLTNDKNLQVVDSLVFAEIPKQDGDWNFRAVGNGFKGGDYGLIPLMLRYNLPIASHPLIDPIVAEFKKQMGLA